MRLARRLFAIGAAALVATGAAADAPARKPQRIMSINLCTDLLLLQMAPRSRIVSVSFLAQDGAQELFPGRDAGIPLNHGTSEEIARFRPDLILAGEFTTPLARKVAAQVGAPIVGIKEAASFADIRVNIRRIGAALGETDRAEAMIRGMDAQLAQLARAPGPGLRVVAWSGGTTAPGQDTLSNAIIETAGAVNIAALPGANPATFDIEQLVAAQPDALLTGGALTAQPSLQGESGRHPLVRRLYGARRIAYRDAAYTCGLPQSATAAADLRRALQALPPAARLP
jgi:iron complex transport system substrate-binding protein